MQDRTSVIILYKLKDSRNLHANLLFSELSDIQHKSIEGINNSRKKKSATHLRGKTKNATRAQKCRVFALPPSAYIVQYRLKRKKSAPKSQIRNGSSWDSTHHSRWQYGVDWKQKGNDTEGIAIWIGASEERKNVQREKMRINTREIKLKETSLRTN